jgi:hypothetical protein
VAEQHPALGVGQCNLVTVALFVAKTKRCQHQVMCPSPTSTIAQGPVDEGLRMRAPVLTLISSASMYCRARL